MKKILSGIIVAAMIISMVGCTNKVDANKTNTNTTKTNETSAQQEQGKKFDYDTFVNALQKENFKVEKGSPVAGLIGEIDGYQYKINGTAIGVYRVDLNSKNPVTVENIKSAKESGKVKLDLQQGSTEVPGKINNNLLIMDFDKHPDKEKILKVFMDLK